MPFASITLSTIALNSSGRLVYPASSSKSKLLEALALSTYPGSFLDKVNSASFNGFDLYEEVSPDGISSSVVVTLSKITLSIFSMIFSLRLFILGQSLILGPKRRSSFLLGLENPKYTLLL